MIKAMAMTAKGPLIVFGLSHENLKRLKDGQRIRIDMTSLGGTGHIVIFSGNSEASMTAELADLIGPQTRVTGMKQ
jgi:hypothetical protein